MAKLPELEIESFSDKTRKAYDKIVATRGYLVGPYKSLIYCPELALHVGDLGSYLRFGEGRIPGYVRELVILFIARSIKSGFEWVVHRPFAIKEGISEDIIEAVRVGKRPGNADRLQLGALSLAQNVIDYKSIPADLQEELIREVGIEGVVELVVLCGFYRMIGGIIAAFDIPMPEGQTDPFRTETDLR